MSAPRELKRRITSVQSTKQITKAMELVSTAKLRRASENTLHTRPYTKELETVLTRVLSHDTTPTDHPLLQKNGSAHALLIIFNADRGLAGSFSSNLVKETLHAVARHQHPRCIIVGGKIKRALEKEGVSIIQNYPLPTKLQDPADLHALFAFIIEQFLSGNFGQVELIYTHFHSMLRQDPVTIPLLPIQKLPTVGTSLLDPLFEPNAHTLLDVLLPHYLQLQLYQAGLESNTSEQAARRLAMRNATDNAGSMIDRLSLSYNTLRQAAITQELAEISSGSLEI